MKDGLLITFGCSWTYGVGAGYLPDMTMAAFTEVAWDPDICNALSYRGVLSKRYNLTNLNFSQGGSSNLVQFGLAKEYFSGREFEQHIKIFKKIVVLHAITSTARTALYDVDACLLRHVKYTQSDKFSKFMVQNTYNHNREVNLLYTEMQFWNSYYQSQGIENIWVDTFNHHYYPHSVKNLVGDQCNQRDLLSMLCKNNNVNIDEENYHHSMWKNDTSSLSSLVGLGLIDPISFHPTKEGHLEIAAMLSPVIESKL